MDLISFIIILLILYLLYKILYCSGKKENIEGFIDRIKDEDINIKKKDKKKALRFYVYISFFDKLYKDLKVKKNKVTFPSDFDPNSIAGDYLDDRLLRGKRKKPEETSCRYVFSKRIEDIINDKLKNDPDLVNFIITTPKKISNDNKITVKSIKVSVDQYLESKNNYNEFFKQTASLLDNFNCRDSVTEAVKASGADKLKEEELKRKIKIEVEKLNIPETDVALETRELEKKFIPKIKNFCKRYHRSSNESLNLLDFKPIPLEANTLEKQNNFLEKEVLRHKKLDDRAKRKIFDDCNQIVRKHAINIFNIKKECHRSGERCFDTIKDEKIKQSTNVTLTDNKNFREYLENCNKDLNRCGYIDDDQPPLDYLKRKNEYMNTLNNYNKALLNFKSIKDNETLRLELYKKAYGNKQWNEGYNSPPPPPPEKKVNEYQKDTPQWIINDISDLEENKIVNTKLLENERINVDQTKESIKSLVRQNFILDEKIKKYDNLIRDNKSEKVSLSKLPLRCEECVPCRTCNKCITLSKYEDLNKCPKCTGCNKEVNVSIDTQKNICDTRILQLQNELDRAVTKKQNDLKNDERWPELNSKLAELSRKKALQSSSMRSCENEKLIKDTGIQESIRNIKRMKLKNEELQDRIDHERDVVSWLDRLKGVSKPFKPKKNYSIGIEEPKSESSESSE